MNSGMNETGGRVWGRPGFRPGLRAVPTRPKHTADPVAVVPIQHRGECVDVARPSIMKRHYASVLMDMCEHQRLSDITVTSLIRTSGTALQTFYNHFSDLNDLIGYTAGLPLQSGEYAFSDIRNTRKAYETMLQHKGFFTQLPNSAGRFDFHSTYTQWLLDLCDEFFMADPMEPDAREYRAWCIKFYIGGCVDILIAWWSSGMGTPVDTLVRIVWDMAPDFIKTLSTKTPTNVESHPR